MAHPPRTLARLTRPFYSRKGFVYFAERVSDGAIKIGFSKQVGLRIRQHGWDRHPVRLIGVVEGSLRLERELHSWFSAARPRTKYGRVAREWFLPTQALRDWMGVFVTTTLDEMNRPVPIALRVATD